MNLSTSELDLFLNHLRHSVLEEGQANPAVISLVELGRLILHSKSPQKHLAPSSETIQKALELLLELENATRSIAGSRVPGEVLVQTGRILDGVERIREILTEIGPVNEKESISTEPEQVHEEKQEVTADPIPEAVQESIPQQMPDQIEQEIKTVEKVEDSKVEMPKVEEHYSFTSWDMVPPKDHDIRAAVDDALAPSLQTLVARGINLRISFRDNIPAVRGSGAQLLDLFGILLTSAQQAVLAQGNGTMGVAARIRSDGKAVESLIMDTGRPLDESVYVEAFSDPPPEQAEGIVGALARCRRICQDLGGGLDRLPGEATGLKPCPTNAFLVTLPILEETTKSISEESSPKGEMAAELDLDLEVDDNPIPLDRPKARPIPADAPKQNKFDIRLNLTSQALSPEELKKKVRALRAQLDTNERGEAPRQKLLVVDDEKVILTVVSRLLQPLGTDIVTAESAEEGLGVVESQAPPHLIITDKNLPGKTGLDLLKRTKEVASETEVIMMTGYASLETALEAIDYGAFDYITKPFDDLSGVRQKVLQALQRQKQRFRALQEAELMRELSTTLISALPEAQRQEKLWWFEEAMAAFDENHIQNLVLVLDDDEVLVHDTEELGFHATQARSRNVAIQGLRTPNLNLVVIGKEFDGMSQREIIRTARECNPDVGVIVVTRDGSLKAVQDAMTSGASDVILRPLEGKDFFQRKLRRCIFQQNEGLRVRSFVSELRRLNSDIADRLDL